MMSAQPALPKAMYFLSHHVTINDIKRQYTQRLIRGVRLC